MALNSKLQFPKDSNKGFTLVETFVAITILLIAVVGPLSLVAKSLSNSIFAQNQIASFYLGQEGLELVINKVAENEANNLSWLDGLEDCQLEEGCYIFWDTEEGTIEASRCTGEGGCPFLIQSEEGLFQYEDDGFSGETIFKRIVKISDTNDLTINGEEVPIDALVTVTMQWTNRDREQEFSVSTLIYNYFNQDE